MKWASLHVHSQYSILDSTASVAALALKAAEYQMPALALTDSGNLFGTVDFFKECKKVGVKPIIGCELFVAPTSRHEKKRIAGQRAGYPLVFLAKDSTGYRNLCKLSSFAHLEGFYYTPRIDAELLRAHFEGLICLGGGMRSKIAELILQDNEAEALKEIQEFKELFKDDFYFELTRHLMSEEMMRRDGMDKEPWLFEAAVEEQKRQEKLYSKMLALSKELGISCVGANDTRYIDRDDWKAHEILLNIASGEPCEIWERDLQGNPKARVPNPKRKVMFSHEYDFKSPEAMAKLFADCPEAIAKTMEVADKCRFEIDFKTRFYPVFVPPKLEGKSCSADEREKEAALFLRELCESGIAKKYTPVALAKVAEKYPGKDPLQVVKDRLDYELDLIISKGMGDYLLIVCDFISWAKRQGIPMGPGRGSGAGSIVCYLTGITDIEPLRFNLFFERFINPERLSYPDIDVDICMDRRQEVIEYTVQRYGKNKVAQIITFGTMKAKMAIKDVGRVLSIPLSKVNEIAKLVPEDPNMTLDKALELDADLRKFVETDEETNRLITLARKLEGSVRNTGIHAAGMIISADPIMDHIPVCNAKDSTFVVTQYAMKPVEAVGMLKIDFLGLKTLTAIQLAVDSIKEFEGKQIDWVNLPLDDKPTFDLLNQGKTLGIFQLESGGMQELAKQLHIDKFEEIIAVNALYRPGPMEMIPSFIRRKHGQEEIEIDHPLIADILAETYGIMVYQEQVMQMASLIAGYSLGEGDVLRRAMGKKDHTEMGRQREKFRTGAIAKGIDEAVAMQIFDKVEKFASYGFNKSHAAAYAYLSYVTAYLKAHYPVHWMAALLTSDRDDLSKVTKMLSECQAMGIATLSPDINESAKTFTPTPKGIRFAMTAIKGVGEGVVDVIVATRKADGPFKSLYDFVKRIDTQKVGKKTIETLIEAGAFDFTHWSRAQLLAGLEPIFARAQKEQRESSRGEMNLFSLLEDDEPAKPDPIEVPRVHILRREKELLGFYLTGHPLENYEALMQRLSCVPLLKLHELALPLVIRSAFVIEEVTIKLGSKNNRKFAILKIGDSQTRLELPIWSELYEEKSHLLQENQLIYAVLEAENSGEGIKLQCHWLADLTQIDEEVVRQCDLAYDKSRMQAKFPRSKTSKPTAPAQPTGTLHLTVDADKMRHSHILKLKDFFRTFPGKTRIQISFIAKEKPIGEIAIDPRFGVDLSSKLIEELRRHPAIVNLDFPTF